MEITSVVYMNLFLTVMFLLKARVGAIAQGQKVLLLFNLLNEVQYEAYSLSFGEFTRAGMTTEP